MNYINQHKAAIITIAAVAGFYLILFSQGITCPIKYVTGISCACCGMTRAWISLAGGDLQRAFSYHPLVLAPVLLIPMFIYRKKIPENYLKVMIAVVCAVFLFVYGIRMADPKDLVVTFDPKSGVILKTLDLILRFFRDIIRCIHPNTLYMRQNTLHSWQFPERFPHPLPLSSHLPMCSTTSPD